MKIYKIKNKYSIFNLLLFVLLTLVAVSFQSCKSSLMRANKYHYKATKFASEGKTKKAISYLKKAINLQPKNNTYHIDLAALHLKKGNKKAAMRSIDQIQPKDNATPEDLAKLQIWKGIFALNLSQRGKALTYPMRALETMNLYDLEYPLLRSHAYCNLAVADIICQSRNSNPKEDPSFAKVHKVDFERARKNLIRAIENDSLSCTAKYNLNIVEEILKESNPWKYGYLPDTFYQELTLPIFDCYPPKEENSFDYDYSSLAKELKEADQLLLVLDISGSMSSVVMKKGKTGSRFELMKEAVDYILTNLDSTQLTGAITVGGSCATNPLAYRPVNSISRKQLQSELANLPLFGGTPLTDRLVMAADMFEQRKKSNKTILLFSDGIGGCDIYQKNACGLGELFNEKNIKFYAFSLLLEKSSTALEYSVYQCLVNATDGLMIGVTEESKTTNKTRAITTEPFSVPLVIADIANTELTPFMEKNEEGLDSLGTSVAK